MRERHFAAKEAEKKAQAERKAAQAAAQAERKAAQAALKQQEQELRQAVVAAKDAGDKLVLKEVHLFLFAYLLLFSSISCSYTHTSSGTGQIE